MSRSRLRHLRRQRKEPDNMLRIDCLRFSSQTSRLACWVACCAFAFACGSKPPPPPPPPPPKPEPVKATPPAVTVDGVSGITAATVVDQATLDSLFPGYTIEEGKAQSEGEEFAVWNLSRGGAASLSVEPGEKNKVYRVRVVDPETTTPSGIKIGQTYKQLADSGAKFDCFRLSDSQADSVGCYLADAPNVGYVLGEAAKGHRGGAGTLPRKKKLMAASITEISWLPPDSE